MSLYRIEFVIDGFPGYWQGVADNKLHAIEKCGIKYSEIVNIEVIMDYWKVTYLQNGLYGYWIGMAYDRDHAISKANVNDYDLVSAELFDEIESKVDNQSIKKLN